MRRLEQLRGAVYNGAHMTAARLATGPTEQAYAAEHGMAAPMWPTVKLPTCYGSGIGSGYGYGYGYGSGIGSGSGDGYGDGYGYGDGDGDGYGDGYGYGYGDGIGSGSGDGDGYGYGSGIGTGSGDGYGYGDGDGDGIGTGDGYGDGKSGLNLNIYQGDDNVEELDGKIVCLILHNRHVYVGRLNIKCNGWVCLTNARSVRYWAGERAAGHGLGRLCRTGPKSGDILDPCPPVWTVLPGPQAHIVECNQDAWAKEVE